MFGPSGTSSCVSGGNCHTNQNHGFACGTSASSCYNGFVSYGEISPGSGATSSAIVDPNQGILCGSGLSGNMPRSPGKCLTSAQVTEIQAWLATGAPDN
jgi:hypothetical protein